MPRTYIEAIGSVACLTRALIDPRTDNRRSRTLLESYAIIANGMFHLIAKNDAAVNREETPEIQFKFGAYMVHAHVEFLRHRAMESYAQVLLNTSSPALHCLVAL